MNDTPPSLEDETIEGLSRAIYNTHLRPPTPTWDNSSENVKDWVRAQARNALAYLNGLTDG